MSIKMILGLPPVVVLGGLARSGSSDDDVPPNPPGKNGKIASQ